MTRYGYLATRGAKRLPPIFLLILLGFSAVRVGWVPREGTLAMERYVISFALPALGSSGRWASVPPTPASPRQLRRRHRCPPPIVSPGTR